MTQYCYSIAFAGFVRDKIWSPEPDSNKVLATYLAEHTWLNPSYISIRRS